MTALPTPTAFDYALLDPAVADKAREAADRIRTLTRAAVQDVGRELLAIRKQVEHGQFTAWVEHECGINIRTAQRAMRAAQFVAKNDKLSYLPQDGLLALSARSTPAAVVSLVIDKIERGEPPTVAEIKQEITAHSAGIKRPSRASPAREPAEAVEAADPLGWIKSAIKALSDELRAEFGRWFSHIYPDELTAVEKVEIAADNDSTPTIPPPADPMPGTAPVNPVQPPEPSTTVPEPPAKVDAPTLTADDGGLIEVGTEALWNAGDWGLARDYLAGEASDLILPRHAGATTFRSRKRLATPTQIQNALAVIDARLGAA